MMALIWMRHYPTYDMLASLFNMSTTAVSRELYLIIPLMWYYFKSHVAWPTPEEWLARRGKWERFPNAVGATARCTKFNDRKRNLSMSIIAVTPVTIA